jgi:phosphate transport system substrate-binding protein
MSQKNETIPLLLALAFTIAIIGGVSWWLIGKLGIGEQNSQPESERSQPAKTFAEVQKVPSGLFSYGGSTTWAPIRKEVDAIIENVFPDFQLRYTDPTTGAPGSGSGIKMLLNNQLAFSQSSRPLKPEEYQQASERGFTLKEIPVAFDAIAVAVHPDLNLSGITVAQLKDIYTGKITNWSQVGGPNLVITPYSRRIEEGGTIEFFAENVLEGENFGNKVEFIPTTTQALRKISETPGSIYYASAPEIVPQCTVKSLPLGQKVGEWKAPYQEPFIDLSRCPQQRNQLNQTAFQKGEYPITRRLFVIVKQNGQADEQAGVVYANLLLTRQGQDLITKTGFVSIR